MVQKQIDYHKKLVPAVEYISELYVTLLTHRNWQTHPDNFADAAPRYF
jgi:hypothetical protein